MEKINTNRFSENVTCYDKNGNIKTLQRYGQTSSSGYGLIDNLTYTLSGNQLNRVDDAVTASAYNNGFEFKNGASAANEYTYDANGNLTKDSNKGITLIQYNVLNLPGSITFSDGSVITYTYGADGIKLRTVHKIGGTTTTTDYCSNVIYENNTAKLLLTEEGYVSLNDNKYHYYLKDHQGNNRVVINQSGGVDETNHYYPFGGVFAGTNNVQSYKYNGKELDSKKGLNWYDYGARHYDAALGRWHVADPMSELRIPNSGYSYVGNNPINKVDLDGMLDDWVEDRHKLIYWDSNAVSQATTKQGETYLGKVVVDFSGSRYEKLGEKNGRSGYINGKGAITAQVTVYGSDGPNDINRFTGYTMTSNADKYGPIDEGVYDANYDIYGKSGALKSHWVLNKRGPVRMLDGKINPNSPSQINFDGEGYKNGIFIHSTNSDGSARGRVSTGCLLIAPTDWNSFNKVMNGVDQFKVRVTRTIHERVPLQGVTGTVPNQFVVLPRTIY